MTTEELLKPRYKLIKDYPDCIAPVGSILQDDVESCIITTPTGSVSIQSSYLFRNKDKYPHLFQKLEWWEDRKEDELPGYVKLRKESLEKFLPWTHTKVFKVYKWRGGIFWDEPDNEYSTVDNREFDFEPATEEEYKNQPHEK